MQNTSFTALFYPKEEFQQHYNEPNYEIPFISASVTPRGTLSQYFNQNTYKDTDEDTDTDMDTDTDEEGESTVLMRNISPNDIRYRLGHFKKHPSSQIDEQEYLNLQQYITHPEDKELYWDIYNKYYHPPTAEEIIPYAEYAFGYNKPKTTRKKATKTTRKKARKN